MVGNTNGYNFNFEKMQNDDNSISIAQAKEKVNKYEIKMLTSFASDEKLVYFKYFRTVLNLFFHLKSKNQLKDAIVCSAFERTTQTRERRQI